MATKSVAEGHALAPRGKLAGDRYFSKDFAQREWDAVWTQSWLLVCRADEIPEAGDFITEQIGPESLLVVRQRDATIRAFYNVCQHRGNQLMMVTEGSMDSFTCAYHSWKWDLDGLCIGAQDPEDFTLGSPCGRKRLSELRCETFASFIWISMADAPPPLEEYLGDLYPILAKYPFEHMTRTQAISVRMPCNWKVVQDNFRETYHIPTAHPEGLYVNEPYYGEAQIEPLSKGHALLRTPGDVPSRYLPGGKLEIDHFLIADLKSWDLDPQEFVGREASTRLALQQQRRKLGEARGHAHYAQMSDEQLTDTFLYSVFPNTTLTCFHDSMLFLRALPHPTDPEKCTFDTWFYAFGSEDYNTRMLTASGTVKGVEADLVEREWRNFGEGSLGMVLDGDAGIMEAQQKAFHSKGYRGAELAGQERRIAQYHNYIDHLIEQYYGTIRN
jgi:phenylpropionate dioxygenase-like ring-hydroxylating dioxygenase large terminal subunit